MLLGLSPARPEDRFSPGFIDLHAHLTSAVPRDLAYADPMVRGAAAADAARFYLDHGFTTVRDAGGTPPDLARAIESGRIDEETARLCAEKGVAISTQVLIFRIGAQIPNLAEKNRKKFEQVLAGQDRLMEYIRKYDVETGFGTDLVFGTHVHLAEELVARTDYFSPGRILRQATSESARILRRAGELDPWDGRLGEIREGFLADLLLIEGDPFEEISILTRPEESLMLIMKGGEIHQESLPE